MNVSKNQNHATSSRTSFHSFLIDEEDFKQECRTFRNLFYAILARIQGHPVFHTSDTTGRPQEDPEFQLQISLKREGSTASLLNITANYCKTFLMWSWDGTVYKASGDSFDEPLVGSCIVEIETKEEEEGNAGIG